MPVRFDFTGNLTLHKIVHNIGEFWADLFALRVDSHTQLLLHTSEGRHCSSVGRISVRIRSFVR